MAVTTPLGKDVLLLVAFTGSEAVSQLFHFRLELLAENQTEVPFDRLLGQKITISLNLSSNQKRYINGLCNRVSQGKRDAVFTSYYLEIVPQFWLLTKRAQSRIFQHVSVPDILKKVLTGLDVAYELQGSFAPRDYCTQYRESDYDFASRLMEEEGIYYFFKHTADGHEMVVANTPQSHPELSAQGPIIYEELTGGLRDEERVTAWEKVQELRSGKYTLWDHCFELPHKHLEADKQILDGIQAGKASHKLKVGGNEKLEIYDYPGGYAQRFDGVDRGGGDQPADLQKIFEDNKRTAEIRMQQEAVPGLVIQGISGCRQFICGHKFTLTRHFSADGQYLLTGVQHTASLAADYRSGEGEKLVYQNRFTCIPLALPYRPARVTPKPAVRGTQTAVVVGSPGEEIFTDKYGRVKVQFHWDREGKSNADSSCWVRVGTLWAGKQWGSIYIPRIGQEVIVDFLEGDPDNPIIIGSVYNAEQMPPYKLPDNKTQSGLKTRSTLQGGPPNFNELRFEDKKGSEDITFHAEKDFHREVENDDDLKVGHDQTIEIKNNRTEKVKEGDEKVTIEKGNRTILVETGDDTHEVKQGNRQVLVDTGNDTHEIKMGNREVKIDMGNDTLTISMGNQTTKLDLGKSETEAMQSIELKVGQSSIKVDQTGVTIQGLMVQIQGQVQTQVKGLITQVSADAMLQMQGAVTMIG
jgi:type VI secretion system secreted protein VgrG